MAQDRFIDIEDFKPGLRLLEDPTKAPPGSARVMTNMMISDRGGITKRPGTLLLGATNANANACHGFFSFRKTDGTELLMKGYDDELEYFHPVLLAWHRLEDGFTVNKEFGFKEHLVNTDNEDYVYFCNRTEAYRRWSGATTKTSGAYSGGTTLNVDATLKTDVYESKTAASVTTTTIDVAGTPWAASQWVNFYVRITSGAQSGKVSKITANTSAQITFDTIAGLSGTPTFEIRLLAFPASGTLVVNGTQVAYSAIPTDSSFTITDPSVTFSDDAPVTTLPTAYPADPRGNRLESHYARMIIGNVRSALSRDSGGTLQGSASERSYYVSKLKDATDFTFSATRSAGQGDIASVAYGGGAITDIANFEDSFAVFTPIYIELAKYSQDGNDLLQRQQLKPGIGSKGRVVRGKDDIFFVTDTNEITSIGRVRLVDQTPQSLNIGHSIKRMLDSRDFSATAGDEYKNRLLFACKASSGDSANNRVIVYNQVTRSFEGDWLLSGVGFAKKNGNLFMAESTSPDVLQLFIGESDVRGTTKFPITSDWRNNWMNLSPISKFDDQAVYAFCAEGYIRGNTTITFSLYKDFSDDAALTVQLTGTDDNFLSAQNFKAFLGGEPLGLGPEGAVSDADADGNRHFSFVLFFPDIYGNYFSCGIQNSGIDQYFDVTRVSLGVLRDTIIKASKIKSS